VPPELARGEAATSASDLWSFGALLIELLGGRSALGAAAEAPQAVVRNAIRRAARLPRAEGRLLAELLQADPSRRPNARAVLQRLQSIRQRGRRRAGLAIAVGLSILISGGVTRYVLDLRHERNLALAARSDADVARLQAEDMALFIVEDLYNGLMPLRRLDLLEPVAAKAVGYFGPQVPADGRDAQSPRPERGLALMRAAEVLDFQGRLPESIDAYHRAVSSLQPLAEAGGSTGVGLRARSLLAQALSAQSMTLGAAAHYSEAMVQAQRALDTSLSLIAEVAGGGLTPAQIRPAAVSLELWQNLLDAYLALGDSQMRAGHPEQAIAKLEEAIGLAEFAVSAHPSIETTRGDLLWTRCMAYLDSSRRDGQVEACRPSLVLDRQAAADDPDDVQTAFNLANSLWLMSKALGRSGQPMAALAHADEAVHIARELARHDPGQPQSHNLLAVSLLSRAHALGALQQNAARQRTLEDVVEITRGIVSGSEDHQFMHTHLTVLTLLGRMDEARPWAQKLRDAGWKRHGFFDLCQRHALLADCLATASVPTP
jgi:tetratricopeptide (TPR) repeat protein